MCFFLFCVRLYVRNLYGRFSRGNSRRLRDVTLSPVGKARHSLIGENEKRLRKDCFLSPGWWLRQHTFITRKKRALEEAAPSVSKGPFHKGGGGGRQQPGDPLILQGLAPSQSPWIDYEGSAALENFVLVMVGKFGRLRQPGLILAGAQGDRRGDNSAGIWRLHHQILVKVRLRADVRFQAAKHGRAAYSSHNKQVLDSEICVSPARSVQAAPGQLT